MNFRQRIAWLGVLAYLGGTFAFFYYLFEINDHYNTFALDHVQRFHTDEPQGPRESHKFSLFSKLWGHLTDLPLTFWLLVLLVPYLQVFMMILACTRVEPKLSLAYMWPGLVYLKYQQLCARESKSIPLTVIKSSHHNGMSNSNGVLNT